MLTAMRDGAKSGFMKIILMGLMTLAVFGLVLTDVGGFFRGGIPATTVAEIGARELSTTTFDTQVRRVLRQQGLDAQSAYQYGFIHQILYSEIGQNLYQVKAADMGLSIDNEFVAQHIATLIKPHVASGMTPEEAMRRVLYAQNMSEQQFARMIKAEIQNKILSDSIANTSYAPSDLKAPMIQDLYKFRHESRKADYIILKESDIPFSDLNEASDDALRSFYEEQKNTYAIPETRSFSYVTLNEDHVKSTLEISDEMAQEYYNDNLALYRIPEQRKIAQAILPDEVSASVIAERARRGGSLQDAVEKETGMSDAYMGEEYFEEGSMIEELSASAFEANINDVTAPMQTALGWHVFKVIDIKAEILPPFESLKAEIKKELKRDQMAEEIYVMANAIDDRLAGGDTIEELAAAMDLPLSEVGSIRSDGSSLENKDALKDFETEDRTALLTTAFELLENESSPVTELDDGRFLALQVNSVQPLSYKSFEEVKADVKAKFIAAERERVNFDRANALLSELESLNTTLKDYASSSSNVSVKSIGHARIDDAEKPLTRASKQALFNTPLSGVFASEAQDGIIVAVVTDITMPDISESADSDDLELMTSNLKGAENSELTALFMAYLHKAYDVQVNERVLELMYSREADQASF